MKKRIILCMILILVIVLFIGVLEFHNYNEINKDINENIISNEVIEETKEENTEEIEEKNVEENLNEVLEMKEEIKEVSKPIEQKSQETSTQSSVTEEKVTKAVSEIKKEEIQENRKEPIKCEEQTSTPVTIEKPVEKQEIIVQNITEEYRYNDEMTQRIINIINCNPSEYMKLDGYTVVVDSSITNLTNQFTFSDERVINKILYKAGTIRVYAQDYYYGGDYLFTECYIM